MRRLAIVFIATVPIMAGYPDVSMEGNKTVNLFFCCAPDNDLYRALGAKAGSRFETPAEAIANAPERAGVLILADGYPGNTTNLAPELFEAAAAKNLRLYVEYPAALPDLEVGAPRTTQWERAVVASERFGSSLEQLRILAIHNCHYVPVAAEHPDIVVARVAGFDTAVYGLPDQVSPVLFTHPRGDILVATTKLSQFVTARYAPTDAWRTIWDTILAWLTDDPPALHWTPTVRPSFAAREPLPDDVEAQALRRGAEWYVNAKLLIHPSWKDHEQAAKALEDQVGPPSGRDWPVGDGSLGSLEGFNARIRYDGRQLVRYWLRNDCMGETAMALAFYGVTQNEGRYREMARNLADFIYFDSPLTKGPRDDPASPSFGLVGWDTDGGVGVYYGDDNARSMLGAIAASALLETDRWDERFLRCLLANLRTTGRFGFRGGRLDEAPLKQAGWERHWHGAVIHYAPHYEAYLWACFLWAYHQTGHEPFLERTKTALRMTMDAYPDQWRWTNGLQQERARLLLPLAWLVRLEDTPEHRAWLRRIATDLLAFQDDSGAIREQLGAEGFGSYGAVPSNEAYGTSEAPLIQQNGDPLCDLLYTTNFAFIGLHEAAAATGEPLYADAEDRLARFLCRIQIRSEAHPELDGAWFRAFDFNRWEYWASSADLGWGAWSIESGWTVGWIVGVLALRHMDASYWDLTAHSTIERHFDQLLPLMFAPKTGT